MIEKSYPRCAKVKFLSTGHASIWWDQVQARRERKGKGKYMGQDAIVEAQDAEPAPPGPIAILLLKQKGKAWFVTIYSA